jgi:hypothetical protein
VRHQSGWNRKITNGAASKENRQLLKVCESLTQSNDRRRVRCSARRAGDLPSFWLFRYLTIRQIGQLPHRGPHVYPPYTPKFAIRLRQADAMRTTFVWIFLYFPSTLEATQSSEERIDVQVFPPSHLIAGMMQLAMMTAAERYGEFVADFETQGSGLGKPQVIWIGRLPSADQAGVLRPRISGRLCHVLRAEYSTSRECNT